jgi:lysozyme
MMRTAVIIAFLFSACAAMASEFDSPWHSPESPFIIDAYHANSIDWDLLATEPRVVAIIHKATIGSNKIDPGYHSRKREAQKRGYLWGSYHLGVAGNPEKQADHYINTVKPAANELIALDLESLDSRKFMNANEAIRFINRVKQRLGRYPVVYANHRCARIISQKFRDTVFAHTPLWYANFTNRVDDFPTGVWSSYTLWQFSSEILTQKAIPGTKPDMDINVFNGFEKDLRAQWPLVRSAAEKTRTASATQKR